MNNQSKEARRDEVMFAMHQQCERPTAEQIIRWTSRYPEFASDIREHAAIRMEWNAMDDREDLEPSEELLARGRSRALNAVHRAQAAAKVENEVSDETSFEVLLAARGTNVPQLARDIDIERGVLADVMTGRVRPPLGNRLQQALSDTLRATVTMVNAAVLHACAHPRLGQAKAARAPTVASRSYEKTIQASSMSPERKAYWLDED